MQWREEDSETRAILEPLADPDTLVVANAERAVARVLEASCQVPLAVYAVLKNGTVSLNSQVSTPDGQETIQAAGNALAGDAVALGEQVAADLLKYGAGRIIAGL